MLRSYHPLQTSHHDKYLVSFILGKRDGDLHSGNALWESRILVFATSPENALIKVFNRFATSQEPNLSPDKFEGFTSIVPIQDPIEDMTEIEWIDHSGLITDDLSCFIAGKTVVDAMVSFDSISEDNSKGLPQRNLSSWS